MKKLVACLLSVATMVATLYTPAFAYEGQPLGRNVAYNRTVNVSNSFNTNEYNKPDFLTDGNLEIGYQTACVSSNKDNPYEDPQTWSIDLGRSYEIDKIVLYWENAAAKKYKIYVSENKTDWMEVASEEAGEKGRFKYDFAPTNARYVKIELEERTMEIYGYCMYEWQIFTVGSVEEKEVPNLAENATAVASSDDGENSAEKAIDGDEGTMWRTEYIQDQTVTDEEKANENITLSWNSPQTFDTVKVKWGGGYMKGYKLQTSDDGETWTDMYEVTSGIASEYRNIRLKEAVTTSHLRLQGITFGAYCFEIYEIQVYDQTNVPVESINLNYTSKKLNLDKEEDNKVELEYNIAPSNTSQTDVVWSSSNEAVAEVKNGVVAGKSVGRADITIASKDNPNVKKTCVVYVSKELDKSKVTAVRNDKNINVNWTKVAHASSYVLSRYNKITGIVNDIYEGTNTAFEDKDLTSGKYVYTVKAILDENEADANLYSNSVSEESEAVIIPEPVTGIEVANDYQHMGLFVGGSGKIRYSVLPGNATNTNVTFKSLNEKVATVDANGVVTGVSEGNADIVITTEEGGFEAKCTVRVDGIDARGIERVGDKTVTMGLNQTRQLQVKITPSDTTNKNVQWTSSNNSVATVDSNGVVTSKNSGSTIITATTHNELKTEFFIEVETSVTNITLNSNEINLNMGGTFKLDATVNPSNASNKNIKWISANESIATVDQSGNVAADVAGTTYISAVSADGKVIATCTVNVSKPVVTKPAKVKIKSAKKKGKKVTLKWKKISDAAGYVVYMKTNSGKFKAVKTVKKAKTVKAVISLKKGNKYSFKIRAYKLDEETNVYGAYSKIKKVKM
ncbi:Ig-like domain-containing protein [Eubacterium ventriosum]|uniref:Ig-like domain-containing protein n=1 Tax=Eubacterium ventriosum TaxID=39496 RepID=UPI00210969A8|nr:Ig-like domain-containing protein [Eubacterium ventriosum]MCQ5339495.1 Ig-like domain-containing protein [Eubacterium ventriosum]